MKWKLISLVAVMAVSGCGGSDGDSSNDSEDKNYAAFDLVPVDVPECSENAQALLGCWVSSCELVEGNGDEREIYGRGVISFSGNGQFLVYLQSFDNANCVAPASSTNQFPLAANFEVLPRVEGEDEANIDGHFQFMATELTLAVFSEVPAGEVLTITPYDVTTEGALCMASDRVLFHETGFTMGYSPLDSGVIDYQSCMYPLE